MTATAVVEILVVGLQALLWVATLAAAAMGPALERTKHLAVLKEWAPLVTVLALASAYGLGVLVDRWADTLFRTQDRRGDLPAKVSIMRLTVLHESEGIARFLEYQRSRLRIARGMVVNVGLGTLSVAGYLWAHDRGGVVAALVIGAVVLGLTWYAARRIHKAYLDRLLEAYELVAVKG